MNRPFFTEDNVLHRLEILFDVIMALVIVDLLILAGLFILLIQRML